MLLGSLLRFREGKSVSIGDRILLNISEQNLGEVGEILVV